MRMGTAFMPSESLFPYKVSHFVRCKMHSPLCEQNPVHINFSEGHTVAFRSSCICVGGNILC